MKKFNQCFIEFFMLDDLEKPLLVMSFATGIGGFSKGNNLLDVYIRELVPINQAKQNRYTAHIGKALPFGYFIGYTGTGFIYQGNSYPIIYNYFLHCPCRTQ